MKQTGLKMRTQNRILFLFFSSQSHKVKRKEKQHDHHEHTNPTPDIQVQGGIGSNAVSIIIASFNHYWNPSRPWIHSSLGWNAAPMDGKEIL
jgi:hypothetical protein